MSARGCMQKEQECESCHTMTRNPLAWHDVKATADYRAEEYTRTLCNTCFDRYGAQRAESVSNSENLPHNGSWRNVL